jgi:uncharacterized protein (TIGR03437 family)
MSSTHVRLIIGVMGLFVSSIASAGIDVVLSPSALKSNGTVDWSALGPAMTWLRPPQTVAVTGISGLSITATMPEAYGEFVRMDPGNKWNNYFPAGSKMLWNGAGSTDVASPMDLILSRPVYGIGMYIGNNWGGTFTATIAAYDANDVLLGTWSTGGTVSPSVTPPFLGVLSTDLNITRVRLSTSASSSNSDSGNDFAIAGPVIVGLIDARPIVSALQNNYSYIVPGMPNYGIAQGSIFVMYGWNMGPAGVVSQSFPLQRTFSGVQINVTVGGATTQAIPYYVYANQIAAILPSATPVGDGTITVTYNGQTGAAAPIKVVANAPGILTAGGATGLAQATDNPLGRLVNYSNSAKENDIITFWGSGLGAVTADETNVGAPTALPNVPLEVYVGGKKATVQWAGRSAYPGLDQINVYVPSGVTGCGVSVFAKINNMISNALTVPVAVNSRSCTDESSGLSGDYLQGLINTGTLKFGLVGLRHNVVLSSPQVVFDDTFTGFAKLDMSSWAFWQAYLNYTATGSCTVFTSKADTRGMPALARPPSLDAGNSLNLSIPGVGSVNMARTGDGFYGETSLVPMYPTTGTTTMTVTGTGGKDVGAFSAKVTPGAALTTHNLNSFGTIDRAQGATVTWQGALTGSVVTVAGTSVLPSRTSPYVTMFSCLARADDGRFTVPAWVLQALPASQTNGGMIIITNATPLASFPVTGVANAWIQAQWLTAKPVTYK